MKVVHLYTEAEFLTNTRQIMNYYGLREWKVKMNADQEAVGLCRFKKQRLEFSAVHIPHLNHLVRRDVVLHEIAHAMAGVEAGHGMEWRRIARSIGCSALDVIETKKFFNKEIYYTWQGECPQGHRIGSHFKPKNFQNLYCTKCLHRPEWSHLWAAYRYTWYKHGTMIFDPALAESGPVW